ncbi:MAG: DNA replication/repair protein RecF [Proteobacteria bacterium]|nr:DNA replication/repair protein RecF [Pseudomonadota bacterium]
MYLAKLHVADFRNVARVDLEFGQGINLIVGANGAGKTALLEAIFLLARGRSFRSSQTKQLIRRGQSQLLVRGDVVGVGANHALARSKSSQGENRTRIDGEHVALQSRFAELLPLQTLLPGVGDLVLDGPGIRREFVDWGLFHVEQRYLETARRFRKALSQRGAWLKDNPSATLQDDPWSKTLVTSGSEISAWRLRFIADLDEHFQNTLEHLASGLGAELRYADAGFDGDELAAALQMQASFDRDRRYAATHVGPHRADMDIRVGGISAKTSVSRGQAKLLASALLLGCSSLLCGRDGVQPIMLLDDFGAELDEVHRNRFFAQLQRFGCQVIATTTEPPSQLLGGTMADNARVFHVEQGELKRTS